MSGVNIDSYTLSEELSSRMIDLALAIEMDISGNHPDIPMSIIREIVAHTFNSFAWQIHKMGDDDEPPTFIQ